MGRQAPWDEIPEAGSVVPDGIFLLQIDALEEQQSKSGKLMYAGQFSVVEPPEFAGSMIFENYTIGSDEDPEAGDPITWKKSVASRLLKTMLTKAQVPLGGDMDDTCAAAVGMQFLAIVSTETQDGYRPKNKIDGYYTNGERTVGLTGSGRPAARPAPAQAPPRPAPRPAPAPAPARVAPPARPAAAPARPAPAAATPPKVQLLTCTICRQKVNRAEFADHVENCQGATQEA